MSFFKRGRDANDIYRDIGKLVADSVKVYAVRYSDPPRSNSTNDYFDALAKARTLNLSAKREILVKLAALQHELVNETDASTQTFGPRN